MPERASVNQVVQIGLEATEGTAVAALKRFGAMRIAMRPNFEFQDPIVPAGSKLPTAVPLIRQWATFDIEAGVLSYNEVIYPLSSIMTAGVITTPGGATNARQWEFLPNTYNPDAPVSFTAERGDGYLAERVTGLRFNEFGYTVTRDGGIEVSGSGFGRKYTRALQLSTNEVQNISITGGPTAGTFTLTYAGQTTTGIAWNATAAAVKTALEALSNIGVDEVFTAGGPLPTTAVTVEFRGTLGHTDVALMTGSSAGLTGGTPVLTITTTTPGVTATDIVIIPMLASDFSVYVDDTSAALGTTKVLRDFEVAYSIGNRFEPVWVIDAAQTSYVASVELVPEVSMALTLEADAAGMLFVDAAENATKKFIRVEAKAPLATAIDASVENSRYRFTHDFAGVVSEIGDMEERNGVEVMQFTFTRIHDTTWARGERVQVVTTATAL